MKYLAPCSKENRLFTVPQAAHPIHNAFLSPEPGTGPVAISYQALPEYQPTLPLDPCQMNRWHTHAFLRPYFLRLPQSFIPLFLGQLAYSKHLLIHQGQEVLSMQSSLP